MEKVFRYDARVHAETMKQAALADTVNTNRIVHAAARMQAAEEFKGTIQKRMEALTVATRG